MSEITVEKKAAALEHWRQEVGKLHSQVAAKDAEIARLREALQFYADAWCFTTNPKRAGLEWKPKDGLLDDCGNTARSALKEKADG